LNVLKAKWKYRNEISQDEYANAAFALALWFQGSNRRIKDLDLTEPKVFTEVRHLASQHSLYWSDAFQILNVKKGYFSGLADGSQTVLVTADEGLAKAARIEGLRVWYCLGEPAP